MTKGIQSYILSFLLVYMYLVLVHYLYCVIARTEISLAPPCLDSLGRWVVPVPVALFSLWIQWLQRRGKKEEK